MSMDMVIENSELMLLVGIYEKGCICIPSDVSIGDDEQ